MSWKAEVMVKGESQWIGNGLRFATKEAAQDYVVNLSWRWTSVRDTRVVESEDSVTEQAV
jgi:hypothetical protein